MILVEVQLLPRSTFSSRVSAQLQIMMYLSMWRYIQLPALALTTFLPMFTAWNTSRLSWSSSSKRFLSSIMQQAWLAACANRNRILPLWKYSFSSSQDFASHTLRYLSSEALTILPLPSIIMLLMYPSCPESVLGLLKLDKSQIRIWQSSNCPLLDARNLPPSSKVSCRWQLLMPSMLPKVLRCCGSPWMSHILILQSSLPENSLNCPSCSKALIRDSCAWMDLQEKSCSQKSCPSLAPRQRLPLALMAAVRQFLGLMASSEAAKAYFLSCAMLGILICRSLREAAMRVAAWCFCLMLTMQRSWSMSLGGLECQSSTLLSSSCFSFSTQVSQMIQVCFRKPSSYYSKVSILALISPISSLALSLSLPRESRQALAILQSGIGNRLMMSQQYSFKGACMFLRR